MILSQLCPPFQEVSLASFYKLLLCSRRLQPGCAKVHLVECQEHRCLCPHLPVGQEPAFRLKSLSCHLGMEKKEVYLMYGSCWSQENEEQAHISIDPPRTGKNMLWAVRLYGEVRFPSEGQKGSLPGAGEEKGHSVQRRQDTHTERDRLKKVLCSCSREYVIGNETERRLGRNRGPSVDRQRKGRREGGEKTR